jgi:hypothetical protein
MKNIFYKAFSHKKNAQKAITEIISFDKNIHEIAESLKSS